MTFDYRNELKQNQLVDDQVISYDSSLRVEFVCQTNIREQKTDRTQIATSGEENWGSIVFGFPVVFGVFLETSGGIVIH